MTKFDYRLTFQGLLDLILNVFQGPQKHMGKEIAHKLKSSRYLIWYPLIWSFTAPLLRMIYIVGFN